MKDIYTVSAATDDAEQNKGEVLCNEVTAMPARAATAHAEQVSPAVSPAISPNTDENYKIESDGNQSGNQSGTGNVKANCYKCKYRDGVPGDAHSCCKHPVASPIYMMFFMSGKSAIASKDFTIRGNTHGVRSGWFTWPVNFDPVWLEECTLFEQKP